MNYAIEETARRREIQEEYNKVHHVTPKTIMKKIRDSIRVKLEVFEENKKISDLTKKEKLKVITDLEKEMRKAAKALDFEKANEMRDIIIEIRTSI